MVISYSLKKMKTESSCLNMLAVLGFAGNERGCEHKQVLRRGHDGRAGSASRRSSSTNDIIEAQVG